MDEKVLTTHAEQRRYVRMRTVFPVELEVCGHLLQGFIRDVSSGGVCVELKVFQRETEEALRRSGERLALTIHAAFSRAPIQAGGIIAWFSKNSKAPGDYRLGVSYTEISESAKNRILRYAHWQFWSPRLAGTAVALLFAFTAGLFLHDQELIRENRKLVGRIVDTAVKQSQAAPATLASALSQMYGWIASHQNYHTGLAVSFEGDPLLEDTAFTYDQALVCQAFLLFGDREKAESILSFFNSRAEKLNGGYFNAYDAMDGRPMERLVNTGPNVWIGIAALQYDRLVKDGRFLPMAKEIGFWTIALQDAEGGVRGGPDLSWHSTEHNLDAYAFFTMLSQSTGDPRYEAARQKSSAWLKKYAYTLTDRRMLRGKGDATIATDTFSWAVAALGPKTLLDLGFDPQAMMDFAEENCKVTVHVKRSDGRLVDITGFDFARPQNVGRGGVVSSEWTAQMIVAYQILADHHASLNEESRAGFYRDKAAFYTNELLKLLITSPSRTGQGHGCLPYASADDIDTGHGWRTPKGKRTGSLAATAYGVFAYSGYNPLTGPRPEGTR